jgi:hypothetical protein
MSVGHVEDLFQLTRQMGTWWKPCADRIQVTTVVFFYPLCLSSLDLYVASSSMAVPLALPRSGAPAQVRLPVNASHTWLRAPSISRVSTVLAPPPPLLHALSRHLTLNRHTMSALIDAVKSRLSIQKAQEDFSSIKEADATLHLEDADGPMLYAGDALQDVLPGARETVMVVFELT